MFQKAQWIWDREPWGKDEYRRFRQEFIRGEEKELLLTVAAEGNYTAYLNGDPVSSGQYCGYPDDKFADQIELAGAGKEGKNVLEILVWYYGEDSSVYIDDGPGVIFEVTQGNKVLAASGEETSVAADPHYESGLCKKITGQLGFSFHYIAGAAEPEYGRAVLLNRAPVRITPRPVRYLEVGEPHESHLIRQEGNRYLFDLGEETAGYPDFCLTSETEQTILISYGEHIADGWVRRLIGGRDFSFEFTAEPGENSFCGRMRRLAGRYLEVSSLEPVGITRMTLRPTDYPVSVLPFRMADPLRQRIYDVSVRTLRLCMHEHYEDCPWREQALYTMDSRNQMLCGYDAFGEFAFARANLSLIAKGTREDGLLELTFPAVNTPAIPFFSLVYLMQTEEYLSHSGDRSILTEAMPVIDGIVKAFCGRIEENGLIANLPAPYWNFYEWSEHNHNGHELGGHKEKEGDKQYDLILNCMFLYSLSYYEKLCTAAGREKERKAGNCPLPDIGSMKTAIREFFYDESRGLFFASNKSHTYSVLGNSMAILAGIGGEEIAERVMAGRGIDVDPVTLSMSAFWYDALLTFGDRYRNYILEDIDRKYAAMLQADATTFWETELGEADFGGAGSLCHGWSAIPVYYYHLLTDSGAERK